NPSEFENVLTETERDFATVLAAARFSEAQIIQGFKNRMEIAARRKGWKYSSEQREEIAAVGARLCGPSFAIRPRSGMSQNDVFTDRLRAISDTLHRSQNTLNTE